MEFAAITQAYDIILARPAVKVDREILASDDLFDLGKAEIIVVFHVHPGSFLEVLLHVVRFEGVEGLVYLGVCV